MAEMTNLATAERAFMLLKAQRRVADARNRFELREAACNVRLPDGAGRFIATPEYDEAFTRNVRTLYNNDYDNSAGLGVGNDKEYFENYEGRLIDTKGEIGRYVRLYSQGSTYTALNRYTEVEVYGQAVP